MKDFVFHNPVKVVFGTTAIARIGKEAARYGSKALLLIGRGSVKTSGLYGRIVDYLRQSGVETITVEGVKPNPVLSKVYEAIDAARTGSVDMVIGIGGGSVIDSAKAIAAGVPYDGDVWDFFVKNARVQEALPVLAVLTLAATASEMNGSAVVTRDETRQKYSFGSPYTYPKVSFLDPTVTFTVPPDHSAYGGIDAITHLLEPYFNNENDNSELQDNLTLGMIRTVIAATERILEDPEDYDARATMMWSASLALNGLTQTGMGSTKFPVHMIEHSLSALYDIPHAAGLAIVLPGWLLYKVDQKRDRISNLGKNVFGIDAEDPNQAAPATIQQLKRWFAKIGSPVTLADAKISAEDIPAIAKNAVGLARVWDMPDYDEEEITAVLNHCKS